MLLVFAHIEGVSTVSARNHVAVIDTHNGFGTSFPKWFELLLLFKRGNDLVFCENDVVVFLRNVFRLNILEGVLGFSFEFIFVTKGHAYTSSA